MKKSKKLKKIFSLYNIAIVGCIILIASSLWIIFKPKENVTPYGLKLVNSETKQEEDITEEKAKKVAIKQFKDLGEKNLKEENLTIEKIERQQEEYYYICSPENTMEIKIKGGQITRINSASVDV